VGAEDFPKIMDILDEHNVKVTFFMTGGWVDDNPDCVKALESGAIILCHNGAKYTAEALDTMLTNLEEQGYEIVPVSELILRENYHMDVAGKQILD
jgi:peptidoglycan/xylan/chitin deacetylase (PgdA/CDA1 family)